MRPPYIAHLLRVGLLMLIACPTWAQRKIIKVTGPDGRTRYVTEPEPPVLVGPPVQPSTPDAKDQARPQKASSKRSTASTADTPLFPGNPEFVPGVGLTKTSRAEGSSGDTGAAEPLPTLSLAERRAEAEAALKQAIADQEAAEKAFSAAVHKARVVPFGAHFKARTDAQVALEEAKARVTEAQAAVDALK